MIAPTRKCFNFWVWSLVLVFISTKDSSLAEANQPNSFTFTEGQPTSYFFYHRSEYPRDCVEVLAQCPSANSSGIYAIKPDGYSEVFDVYCDSDGYTVMARRLNGIISFNRGWVDYASGFGFLSHEFWLGNQKMSYLTNQKRYLLRIDVTLNDGSTLYATYDEFRISEAYSGYSLISTGQFNIDGGWRYWSPWTPCSETCGEGVKSRHSRCTDGAECVGDRVEKAVCNEGECPVDGGWSVWSDWTECPVSCGGGLRVRERNCNNPVPQHGGQDCTGDAQQNQDCGIDPCPDPTIRLANGNNSYSGRIEIFLNGRWGTVCDDFFGINDGHVACRQLGYTAGAVSVHGAHYWNDGTLANPGRYGAGEGPTHMDDVGCTGSEARLVDCPYVGSSSEDCDHNEDVGVVCHQNG